MPVVNRRDAADRSGGVVEDPVDHVGRERRAMPVAAVRRRSCNIHPGIAGSASSANPSSSRRSLSISRSSVAFALLKPDSGRTPLVVKTSVSHMVGRAAMTLCARGESCTSWARSFLDLSRGIVQVSRSAERWLHSRVPTSSRRWAVSRSSLNSGPNGQPSRSHAAQNQRISSSDRKRSRSISLATGLRPAAGEVGMMS